MRVLSIFIGMLMGEAAPDPLGPYPPGNHLRSRLRFLGMPSDNFPPQHVPFIEQVRRELRLNIGNHERSLSTLAGAGVLGFGLTQPGWRRWLYTLLGGALLKRGMTGHCPCYERFGIDTRHHA